MTYYQTTAYGVSLGGILIHVRATFDQAHKQAKGYPRATVIPLCGDAGLAALDWFTIRDKARLARPHKTRFVYGR
jgi:hypothetical protein